MTHPASRTSFFTVGAPTAPFSTFPAFGAVLCALSERQIIDVVLEREKSTVAQFVGGGASSGGRHLLQQPTGGGFAPPAPPAGVPHGSHWATSSSAAYDGSVQLSATLRVVGYAATDATLTANLPIFLQAALAKAGVTATASLPMSGGGGGGGGGGSGGGSGGSGRHLLQTPLSGSVPAPPSGNATRSPPPSGNATRSPPPSGNATLLPPSNSTASPGSGIGSPPSGNNSSTPPSSNASMPLQGSGSAAAAAFADVHIVLTTDGVGARFLLSQTGMLQSMLTSSAATTLLASQLPSASFVAVTSAPAVSSGVATSSEWFWAVQGNSSSEASSSDAIFSTAVTAASSNSSLQRLTPWVTGALMLQGCRAGATAGPVRQTLLQALCNSTASPYTMQRSTLCFETFGSSSRQGGATLSVNMTSASGAFTGLFNISLGCNAVLSPTAGAALLTNSSTLASVAAAAGCSAAIVSSPFVTGFTQDGSTAGLYAAASPLFGYMQNPATCVMLDLGAGRFDPTLRTTYIAIQNTSSSVNASGAPPIRSHSPAAG